jgi:hypothetical protein
MRRTELPDLFGKPARSVFPGHFEIQTCLVLKPQGTRENRGLSTGF